MRRRDFREIVFTPGVTEFKLRSGCIVSFEGLNFDEHYPLKTRMITRRDRGMIESDPSFSLDGIYFLGARPGTFDIVAVRHNMGGMHAIQSS